MSKQLEASIDSWAQIQASGIMIADQDMAALRSLDQEVTNSFLYRDFTGNPLSPDNALNK